MKHHIDLQFFRDLNEEYELEISIESPVKIPKDQMIKIADIIAEDRKTEDDQREVFYNIHWTYK